MTTETTQEMPGAGDTIVVDGESLPVLGTDKYFVFVEQLETKVALPVQNVVLTDDGWVGSFHKMSSHGTDIARRSLDRPTEPAPRSRDPWACPSCGGPTSVKNTECGEC